MTSNLRRQHPAMIALLAVALAVLFIAGIMIRKPAPTNPQLPDSLLPAANGGRR